jgi:hypothetical protein
MLVRYSKPKIDLKLYQPRDGGRCESVEMPMVDEEAAIRGIKASDKNRFRLNFDRKRGTMPMKSPKDNKYRTIKTTEGS